MRSVSSIRVGSSTSSGRSASCSSTASRSVLDGIVPVWMDTPPRRSLRSATATRLPSFAAWMAAFWPEGPDPMTSMSSSTRVIFPDTGARVPSRPIVPVAVLKLGSSVVAHESGDLRLSVVARLCEEVAGLHRAGRRRRGRHARARSRAGSGCWRCPQRPTEIAELQAASAVGQGRLYRTYDELLREEGLQTAQVLLTFFDMSARTHYLNARRTLRTLLGWRIVPVINENDTTTTDEISFGDNDFLAAQVAVLVNARAARAAHGHGRPLHGQPAPRPGRAAGRGGARPGGARRARDRPRDVAARARAGCAPRSSPRRWPPPRASRR